MKQARLVLALSLVAACAKDKEKKAPPERATADKPAIDKTAEPGADKVTTPKPGAGTADVFYTADKAQMQVFATHQLAVGGGFVYWVNQPRIDKYGLGKTTVVRKPASGGDVETVVPATSMFGIGADGEALYWAAKDAVYSRPHVGGDPKKLAPGVFFQVVPGTTHVLAANHDQVALVPKAGGAPEVVWKGKLGNFHFAADGERFLVVQVTGKGKGKLSAYAPGKPPVVLFDGNASGHVGVHGAHAYFAGGGTFPVVPPLWRVDKEKGGTPEQVGKPDWGFVDFEIVNGALYGGVVTRGLKLQKMRLEGITGAEPTVLDPLEDFARIWLSLDTDATHVYYLTDWQIKRAPL